MCQRRYYNGTKHHRAWSACALVCVCSGISCSIRAIAGEECRLKATKNFRCHFVLENVRSRKRTSLLRPPTPWKRCLVSRRNDSMWIITCTWLQSVSEVHDAIPRFEVAVAVLLRISETSVVPRLCTAGGWKEHWHIAAGGSLGSCGR